MKLPKGIFALIVAALLLGACNLPTGTATATLPTGQRGAETAAAMTVAAMTTEIARSVTSTPGPVSTQPSEPTGASATQPSGSTGTPHAGATPGEACDQASLESETVEDGSSFVPGATFTKSWTLKNNGTCTWNANYALVFVSGEAMSGPASKAITSGTVPPGQTVQVTVDLKAPLQAGTFRGNWKLRNANGSLFGLGKNGDPFWVEIKTAGTNFNFVNNFCGQGVEWRSGAGVLPCPGTSSDANGFVVKLDEPKMENSSTENEAALWANPQPVNGGYISGKFPVMTVTPGSRFKAIVGCLYNANNCNVRFQLSYILPGGSETLLAEWNEKYDGELTRINLDLPDSLDNKSVQFILTVRVNGGPEQAQAFWLQPRIEP